MMLFTRMALAIGIALTASVDAVASSDIDSCQWGTEGCVIASPPVLSISNDTRDNLLRLVSEQKSFAVPLQPLPADIRRSRSYYFGQHINDWPQPVAATASPLPPVLDTQIAALGLDSSAMQAAQQAQRDRENRNISNSPETLSHFFAALLADATLSAEQRQALALARISLSATAESQQQIAALAFPAASSAALLRDYLLAASHFYQGDYPAATAEFTALQQAKQPWVAETASYMLMRTALNQSSQNASGEYGDFDVTKIDRIAAAQALTAARAYLTAWPEGQYASSAQGMLRRINWYLQDWNTLAPLYEQALNQASSGEQLVALIAENDVKLQSKDQSGDAPFISSADAPLLTFTQTLRLMRGDECSDRLPCVDRAYLDSIRPIFENANRLPLWDYLQLLQTLRQKDYPAVLAAITPATVLPAHDVLTFSQQVVYGEALMSQKQWAKAGEHWSHLLTLSQDGEQQQYLQAKLAATLVSANETAAIFTADSRVTNLRYRSLVLKTKATPKILRQQVTSGPDNEERTIALHTLLIKDLMAQRYAEWLKDSELSRFISQPVVGDNFADVQLNTFQWSGGATSQGYYCPTLATVVSQLSKQASNPHAMNCLAEFLRTTSARVDIWPDRGGNDALDEATTTPSEPAIPNRMSYYQRVIADAKSEPEDKSYALYRAVMCYAPSGYNDCGGEEVDKTQRKAWFNQLKREYPGNVWANQLKYYW